MQQEFAIASLGPCLNDSPLAPTIVHDEEPAVLLDATVSGCRECGGRPPTLEAAGPRPRIFFDPAKVRAGIVTCGGLCPGLNDVTRSLTMVLWYRYGVRDIVGLRYGYEGLTAEHAPLRLTPEVVADIHQLGGTVLGTSRGPQDVGGMVDFLVAHGLDMLFTIGGDGTQRGALAIVQEAARRNLRLAVVGIPKTIDNDISFTHRTFGFETAVAVSQLPISSAHQEAKGVVNGVGLVKLMGRESGFIAAYAALASSDVNLVLVPEVAFRMERLLAFLDERLARKSHAVVVVAEGAGQEYVPASGVDASGNRKLGDIGLFLKDAVTAHFRQANKPIAVRYIDPSYTIRSARANADDSVFCFQLAEHAVHAAMAGKTGLVICLWNGHFVHVPMAKAATARKRIDPRGALWTSVLHNTGQPDLA